MTWLMEILRIYLEEQSRIKYFLTEFLTSQKIQNMTDINTDLLQWFENFLIKRMLRFQINPHLIEIKKQKLKKFKKFKNRKVHSIDNIRGAYVADMQLLTLFWVLVGGELGNFTLPVGFPLITQKWQKP